MTYDNVALTETERLALHRAEESPRQVHWTSEQEQALASLENVLSQGMTANVLKLTAERIKGMSQVERRTMAAWIARRQALLDEKSALLNRHITADVDVPDCYRLAGAV